MGLTPGVRFGAYQVTSLIGPGGRGPALDLATRLTAPAKSYEHAPVERFPLRSEASCP